MPNCLEISKNKTDFSLLLDWTFASTRIQLMKVYTVP